MQERPYKKTLEQLGWTADFSKFTRKVESVFGPLDDLVVRDPEMYVHHVLSHGFMEYAGVTGLPGRVKKVIAGSEEKFNLMLAKQTEQKEECETRYRGLLKKVYLRWARANNLPEGLLEAGWEEYLND